MNLIFAAISLGFLGSFHCVGMCGPIALALPLDRSSAMSKLAGILSYNIGRALTYSGFGVLFGLVGKGFAIFGLQQALSIVIGSIILISVLIPSKFQNKLGFMQPLFSLVNSLKYKMSELFSKKSMASLFSIGLLNGLLPCGFVYLAIAGAIASGSAMNGAIFMAGFGLGTVPVMIGISWFASLVSMKFRDVLGKAFPYVMSVMAILMIVRGLNLGIPYISPKMDKSSSQMSCHTTISCHPEKKSCCHK